MIEGKVLARCTFSADKSDEELFAVNSGGGDFTIYNKIAAFKAMDKLEEMGFNFFEGETHQVKQKMADVLSVTRYLGIKCSKV